MLQVKKPAYGAFHQNYGRQSVAENVYTGESGAALVKTHIISTWMNITVLNRYTTHVV